MLSRICKRQQVIHEHDMKQQENETQALVEDEEEHQHLHLEEDLPDDHPVLLVNTLVAAGVERIDAINAVSRMTANLAMTPTTFCEVYGRGEIVKHANTARRNLNIKGLKTSDMREKRADGTCWDLSKPSHRRDAYRIIDEMDPDWIIAGRRALRSLF